MRDTRGVKGLGQWLHSIKEKGLFAILLATIMKLKRNLAQGPAVAGERNFALRRKRGLG